MKKPRSYFCFTDKGGVTSAGVCHPSSAVGSYGNPTGTLTPLQGNPGVLQLSDALTAFTEEGAAFHRVISK